MERVAARDDAYKGLSVFTDIIHKIEQDYVEQPDTQKAMRGALHGIMEALDPYSSFVDRNTYHKIKELKEQYTASPGVTLSKRFGYAYVVSVVPGSPARRAGLRSGDLLESIDGKLTTQMSLLEAQSLLLGPADSSIELSVIRSRRPYQVRLMREDWVLPEAGARIVEEEIGVLRIPHLEEGMAGEVLSKLKILRSSGIGGLLVDVRGAAYGTVSEAVKVSDFFLDKGKKIVMVKDRDGEEASLVSSTDPVITGIPIVVLIDGGTSGAGELFAAALQDHQIAETVGEKTNGQGSKQRSFFLEDGSVLLMSTNLYYRSTGKAIQGQNVRDSGVAPDVTSPDEEFAMKFDFDSGSDGMEENIDDEFFRKLREAVEREQFETGLERIRSKLLPKAA